MHNSTDYIKNAVVKTLNKLVCHCSISKFRGAFNTLDDDNKQHYISTITVTQHVTAMVYILNAMEKREAVSTFHDLLKENKGFAFNTLNVTVNQSIGLFKTLFNELDSQQKEEYAKYVAKNQKSPRAMFAILNAMEKDQAVRMFYDLLKKNQDFAFSVLRTTSNHKLALFKTLFNELDSQQKEEYAKYVAKNQKSPRAKIYILSTMGNQVVSTLHDLLKKSQDFARNVLGVEDYRVYFETEQTITTPFQDEFSEFNPGTFFPNSVSSEEIIDQHGVNFREVVPESTLAGNCVVDLDDTFSKSEDQSFDELIFWITGERLSSSLRSSILERFDKLGELEEIRIEPAAKRQRTL